MQQWTKRSCRGGLIHSQWARRCHRPTVCVNDTASLRLRQNGSDHRSVAASRNHDFEHSTSQSIGPLVHQSIVARCIGPSVHRCQMHWGIVQWWQTALHSDSKMDPGMHHQMNPRIPNATAQHNKLRYSMTAPRRVWYALLIRCGTTKSRF